MDAMSIWTRWHSATCFNPRARDGRDFNRTYKRAVMNVSIHAPVMDAINVNE